MTVFLSLDHIAPLGVINRINSGTKLGSSEAKPFKGRVFCQQCTASGGLDLVFNLIFIRI